MRSNRYLTTFILILVLTGLACGLLDGDDPTPEPEAVATTAPSEAPAPTEAPTDVPEPTAVPTDTPAPTDTPEVTAGFITFSSETAGITVDYPETWFVEDFFFITIASSEGLLEDVSGQKEGGALLIIAEDAGEFEGSDPVEILTTAMIEFELDEGMAIVEEPVATRIQDQDAATATLSGESNDGILLDVQVTAIVNGDRAAIVMAATPVDSSDEYQPTLEAITSTIVVSEPTAEEPFDDPSIGAGTPAGEPIRTAIGESLDGKLSEDTYQDFVFPGLTDAAVSLTVVPDDELDPVLAVFEAGDLDDVLFEVDNGFSGEPETLVFTLPADGEYIIRVHGFAGGAGNFDILLQDGSLLVTDVDALPIGPGTRDSRPLDGEMTFVFQGVAGTVAAIFLAPLDDDLDLTASVADVNGNQLMYEDDGFSGEPEALIFVPETAGSYFVNVSSFGGGSGDFSINMIDPEQATVIEGVVNDGEASRHRFCVPPGEALIVVVVPNEDFDATLEILGGGGGMLFQVDGGGSGEPEGLFVDEFSSSTEQYPLIVAVNEFFGDSGEFTLMVLTDGPSGIDPNVSC